MIQNQHLKFSGALNMTEQDNSIKTPVGRFVGGNINKHVTKDYYENDIDIESHVDYIVLRNPEKNNLEELVNQFNQELKKIKQGEGSFKKGHV